MHRLTTTPTRLVVPIRRRLRRYFTSAVDATPAFIQRRDGHAMIVTGFSRHGVHLATRHQEDDDDIDQKDKAPAFTGMIRRQDVHRGVRLGDCVHAWGINVRHVDEDEDHPYHSTNARSRYRDAAPPGNVSTDPGRRLVDMAFAPPGAGAVVAASHAILQALRDTSPTEPRGTLHLGDGSPPAAISTRLGISKGTFKKAVGHLFRRGVIDIISRHEITLRSTATPKVDAQAWAAFKQASKR